MKNPPNMPLQNRVQEAILKLISDRDLSGGDQLPTEPELKELLKVGRSTLREAMSNLVSKGVLERIQGKGTFIRHIPILLENGLDELRSVTEHIRAVGAKPSTSRIEVSRYASDDNLAEKLQIKSGDEVVKIERIRRADNAIAAYCIDILPSSLLPNVSDQVFSDSLFDIFHAHDYQVSHADSVLHPTLLTRRELPEMTSEVGMFLLFDEVFFDSNGLALCYSNDYYSADIFDFRVVRRR